ncbi:MAG: hypothetical protein JRF63_14815 [Deltaproteobacteria bacterium]|nr:hypothetical protein [Deltaproteobacteria bacterium]
MRIGLAIAATASLMLAFSSPAAAEEYAADWSITGGEAWEGRTGFGVMLGLGGVDCTKDFCDKTWGTKFMGSFEGIVGFYYRLIPNLSFFLDFGLAHMNTDFSEVDDADDGSGLLFHFVGGAAFHAPITGWMDAQLGFGIGFARMKLETMNDPPAPSEEVEVSTTHLGVDFELRFAVDIYLFSAAPTFAVGPYFKLGMPYWAKVCYDSPPGSAIFTVGDSCGNADDIEKEVTEASGRTWHIDETPFLIHFGLDAKYTF